MARKADAVYISTINASTHELQRLAAKREIKEKTNLEERTTNKIGICRHGTIAT
jgi:hypothetical protein